MEKVIEGWLDIPSYFIINGVRKYVSITSLFCLLYTIPNQSEKLRELADTLKTRNTNYPLSLIIHKYLKKNKKLQEMVVDEEQKCGVVEVIRKCDIVNDERINEALNDVRNLGEKLSKLLLSDCFEPEKAGLLVDWLSAVELEIVNLNDTKENVQVGYLFSFLDL